MAQDSTMHHSSAIVNEIILTFGARQVYDKTSGSFVYSSRFLLPTLDSEHSVSLEQPQRDAVSTGKERQTLAEILSFLSQGHVTIVAFVARRV